MNLLIFLVGLFSVVGDINICSIFLFSSSCIELLARLTMFGVVEPGLDTAEEMLRIDGFLTIS